MLLDKDNRPHWDPPTPEAVTSGTACWPPDRKVAGRPDRVTSFGSARNLARFSVRRARRAPVRPAGAMPNATFAFELTFTADKARITLALLFIIPAGMAYPWPSTRDRWLLGVAVVARQFL